MNAVVALGLVAGAGALWTVRSQAPQRRAGSSLGGASAGIFGRSDVAEGARWATRADLRPLAVSGPVPGRLTLGRARGRLVATERGHSVLVVGPTQSRKTTGFAIPALLEWEGPVLAASVKADLARHTLGWRRAGGPAWLYDPARATGLARAPWSPLPACATWPGARRTAHCI